MIPIIEESALRAAVTPERAVAVMREAFRADGEGRTHVPSVINLDIPAARGEFHVKTAYIEGIPYVGVKIASGFYDNPSQGLPSGSGLIALFDASTGFPVALLLDNGFLTDIRTGARRRGRGRLPGPADDRDGRGDRFGAAGEAPDPLPPRRSSSFYTGRRLESDPRERLDAYCAEMALDGYAVRAADSAEEVCAAADVLVTATPARAPLVRNAWLRAGMHVTATGSDSPGKRELDVECLDGADLVVVDRYGQCAAFGELKHALEAALLTRHDVHAELGEIVAGRKPGRTTEQADHHRGPHRRRLPGHRDRQRGARLGAGRLRQRRLTQYPGPYWCMPRFRLLIEYAGTRYSGWQIQKNARTVQGEIDRAIREISRRAGLRAVRVRAHRCRRPRVGASSAPRAVHIARARTAAAPDQRRAAGRHSHPIDCESAASLPRAARCGRALLPLSNLPSSHRVRQAVRLVGPRTAERRRRMREASAAFAGMRDFASFTDDDPRDKSTRVLVDGIEIVESRCADPDSHPRLALSVEDGATDRWCAGGDWPRRARRPGCREHFSPMNRQDRA